MTSVANPEIVPQRAPAASPRSLLDALLDAVVTGSWSSARIGETLDCVERDPLASAGHFPGDLLRGLMEVPGQVWGRHPRLYERYRAALRASAVMRRQLSLEQRMAFWGLLDPPVARPAAGSGGRDCDRSGASAPP